MDDDSDRSSEATQLEEHSTAEDTRHHDDDAGEYFRPVSEDEGEDDDDEETDDQRDFSALAISPMSAEEDSRACQSATLKSDLSDVPVKYEMRRDELEHLKNQLQGSHQEALAIVIAQAAQAHSNQINAAEVDQKDAFDSKYLSASCSGKTPIDGYNWRKYGQKQVKSPEGSRSYYKCTYSECDAKKIESCDQYNSVTKIVYKGHHKHDPPKKESSPKALKRKSITAPGSFQIEQRDEPQQKQRVKKSSSVSPGSVLKPPKKPKFIVHAAVDIEISADGYRWRKYGQKMVKGNPHPRNYYKCTSAGCPVRKHIEKAIDGSSKVIITYKGAHDHDMPVPKKGHGPPNGLLITAARSSRPAPLSNHGSTTEPPKKTSEPARTLLSVGFEIKHC